MKIQIDVQSVGREWTDTPRDISEQERADLIDRMFNFDGQGSSRLTGVKLYREMTSATLKAAVTFVDRLMVERAKEESRDA